MAFSDIETNIFAKGIRKIAGVDEAGRGPIAGPVVAAACYIPEGIYIYGVDDSKKLTEKKRLKAFEELKKHPLVFFGVGIVEPETIDEINILQATLQAMQIAVNSIEHKPEYLLVDGNKLFTTDIKAEAVVKGDSKCMRIAAASCIAKVMRDQIMDSYHEKWPEYGFLKHKGYPTKAHISALNEHGPVSIHRRSFKPVRECLS